MMTRERAEAIYAILQLYAGAPEGGGVRDSFIHIHSTEDCSEFRFCGLLGHGGKYRAPRNKVDCYQEDETPERLAIIERTNKVLAQFALLDELYAWLHEGPMDSWDKRTIFHERIGALLGKPKVEYHE